MSAAYNPIVRTFCQFRAEVLENTDVARHEVRPGVSLEALLPVAQRRHLWQRLRERGLKVHALQLSDRDHRRYALAVLMRTASLAFCVRSWFALLVAVPLGLFAFWVSRRRAVHFPLGLKTVGELVIYMTRFPDHKGSGYRWTRNEIALKVRLIIAESSGVPLEKIQPETTWAELM
jgi:hypothetical protein